MKKPFPTKSLKIIIPVLLLLGAGIYYRFLPLAEVARASRGTAISAVYGTVRIEPIFMVHLRAQTGGLIQLSDSIAAGKGAIGKRLEKDELLATIADETTSRQLKQARADLQAATQRAE